MKNFPQSYVYIVVVEIKFGHFQNQNKGSKKYSPNDPIFSRMGENINIILIVIDPFLRHFQMLSFLILGKFRLKITIKVFKKPQMTQKSLKTSKVKLTLINMVIQIKLGTYL